MSAPSEPLDLWAMQPLVPERKPAVDNALELAQLEGAWVQVITDRSNQRNGNAPPVPEIEVMIEHWALQLARTQDLKDRGLFLDDALYAFLMGAFALNKSNAEQLKGNIKKSLVLCGEAQTSFHGEGSSGGDATRDSGASEVSNAESRASKRDAEKFRQIELAFQKMEAREALRRLNKHELWRNSDAQRNHVGGEAKGEAMTPARRKKVVEVEELELLTDSEV